jgi:transposase
MKLHGSAKTCPTSRRLIARRVFDQGWTLAAAAEAAGVSVVTARKWVERYREGDAVLGDRSSRPSRIHRLADSKVEAIVHLRRLRMTAAEIAESLGLALSTVSRWLKRVGLGKRSRLDPPEPPNRCERRHPGELVHVDIKQLGRISVLGAGHRVLGHKKSQFNCSDSIRGRVLDGQGSTPTRSAGVSSIPASACVIEVALNGMTTKRVNPNVPRGPTEIADDALACVATAATIIHNHNDEKMWEVEPPQAPLVGDTCRSVTRRGGPHGPDQGAA